MLELEKGLTAAGDAETLTQREEETVVPSDCKLVTVNKWSPSDIDTLRSSGVTEPAFTSTLSTEIV